MKFLWTEDINSDLYKKCLELRKEVFVKEKNSSLDLEIKDEDRCIYLGLEEDGNIIGTGRIFLNDDKTAIFQRIAIKKEYRSKGYGSLMINEMENKCREKSISTINIPASMHAIEFYTRLGYRQKGEIFIRGSIEHVWVEK